MKFVIQRVTKAQVDVNGATIGKIGKGFLVLIGVSREDNRAIADKLVKKLIRAYEDVTGEKGYAMAIGGGTYAKCLEEGVAFGALFPGETEMAHQADEYITEESLFKSARIFARAIVRLAGKKVEE